MRQRGGKDKIWAIDNTPKPYPPSNQILIDLGKSLERMFTMEPEEFRNTLVKEYTKGKPKQKRSPQEPCMQVKYNDFLVRVKERTRYFIALICHYATCECLPGVIRMNINDSIR